MTREEHLQKFSAIYLLNSIDSNRININHKLDDMDYLISAIKYSMDTQLEMVNELKSRLKHK